MTDAKDVPICTCFDDWHANNAGNHALTCPVIAAFATLTRERDALKTQLAAARELIEFARIELGGEERDGSEHTHWCVACDDHVDGNHVVRNMLVAALTQEDA